VDAQYSVPFYGERTQGPAEHVLGPIIKRYQEGGARRGKEQEERLNMDKHGSRTLFFLSCGKPIKY
jgi:hypothetical protein